MRQRLVMLLLSNIQFLLNLVLHQQLLGMRL